MNKTRGFTVLELITALFILAMVIAIIIPLSTNIIAEQQKGHLKKAKNYLLVLLKIIFQIKVS